MDRKVHFKQAVIYQTSWQEKPQKSDCWGNIVLLSPCD